GVVLEGFEHRPGLCAWTWGLFSGGEKIATFVRTIGGADREAWVRVTYWCDTEGEVVVRPLLGMRDFHGLNGPGSIGHSDLRVDLGGSRVLVSRGEGTVAIEHGDGFSVSRVDEVWR